MLCPKLSEAHAAQSHCLGRSPTAPPLVDFSALRGSAESGQSLQEDESDARSEHEEFQGKESLPPHLPIHLHQLQAPPAHSSVTKLRLVDFGYGEGGLSVQSLHAKHLTLTDRHIVKMTLLQGTAKITCKQACDKLGSSGHKALPKTTAMTSAHKECPLLCQPAQDCLTQNLGSSCKLVMLGFYLEVLEPELFSLACPYGLQHPDVISAATSCMWTRSQTTTS